MVILVWMCFILLQGIYKRVFFYRFTFWFYERFWLAILCERCVGVSICLLVFFFCFVILCAQLCESAHMGRVCIEKNASWKKQIYLFNEIWRFYTEDRMESNQIDVIAVWKKIELHFLYHIPKLQKFSLHFCFYDFIHFEFLK